MLIVASDSSTSYAASLIEEERKKIYNFPTFKVRKPMESASISLSISHRRRCHIVRSQVSQWMWHTLADKRQNGIKC